MPTAKIVCGGVRTRAYTAALVGKVWSGDRRLSPEKRQLVLTKDTLKNKGLADTDCAIEGGWGGELMAIR